MKVDILGFYVSAIGWWRMSFAKPLRWSSYCKILYKIPSGTDAPFSYIPIKVHPLRWSSYRKKNTYIKFQVGLTLHLAIFPLKSKYKDTDVWNLTYSVWFFGNRLLKNEFCQVLMFDLVVYDNILYFKLDWQSN